MTRDEAKQAIDYYYCHTELLDEYGDYCDQTEYEEAFDMAIKALEHPEKNVIAVVPCGDAISRQAVLDAIDTYDKFGYTETGCFVREPKGYYVPYIHYDDVIKCIKNVSPVTPQQRMGRWIKQNYGWNWQCSECGFVTPPSAKEIFTAELKGGLK